MLAQWIAWAYREGYQRARREPLITLGSAPLEVPEFRAVILGQLGEPRLDAAIEADIAGAHSHARALDADTKGPLRDIHRRLATTILFESSGGMVDKVAHLPELRFALGEPGLDTTSIDTVADALERKSYYLRKVGSDGYRFGAKPTLKKVMSHRRASLDEQEITRAMQELVREEFRRGANLPVVFFPDDGSAIADSPKLTLVVVGPELEWNGGGELRRKVSEWTRKRGGSDRLYPAALLWTVRKPGRELRECVELYLAWQWVEQEMAAGMLGSEFERAERAEITTRVRDARETARDEVWASYRYVVLSEREAPDGLRVIDLGAGHASGAETLASRVTAALKANALLNESVGASYLERHWPPPLRESGAWPLSGLRQSFLDGSLPRLVDPDAVLREKIVEFVERGEFGLASGQRPDGGYARVWFLERVGPEEVVFEPGMFLLTKARARALKEPVIPEVPPPVSPQEDVQPPAGEEKAQAKEAGKRTFRLLGSVPPEVWNRLGTKLLPKLRSGGDLRAEVNFTISVDAAVAAAFEAEVRQALQELGLDGALRIEKE
jgi:hypothetical protein